jgi:hypothetical protein
MPELTVSPLSYPLPGYRNAMLFQSWSQLRSYLCVVLACTLLIHLLAVVSGARVLHPALLMAALAGAGLVSVAMLIRSRFTVSPASEAAVRRVLTEVECVGYVEVGARDNVIVYRPNLPRVLRREQASIGVSRDGDTLVLTGPVVKLRRIRARLARS